MVAAAAEGAAAPGSGLCLKKGLLSLDMDPRRFLIVPFTAGGETLTNENQPVEPPAQQNPAAAITSRGAAGFLMIAAIIIVGGHVLFGIIMGEFTYGNTNVAVSLLILMSILGMGFGIGGTVTQRILGYFLGLSGAVSLLSDIRFGFPDGVVDNLANLVFYAGAVLAFLGARALKD